MAIGAGTRINGKSLYSMTHKYELLTQGDMEDGLLDGLERLGTVAAVDMLKHTENPGGLPHGNVDRMCVVPAY